MARGRRGGATLTEVLMSLLVMGIGVISLATLFPIAYLRTLKAHQLTNAGIVRYNAESLIETYPHLVHDPDNNANFYLPQDHLEFAPPNGTGDQLTEHYRTVYIVDPLGWWTHREQGTGLEDTFGNDATQNPPAPDPARGRPRYNGGGTYPGGAVTVMNSNNHGFLWTESTIAQGTLGIPFITGTPTQARQSAARWFVLPDSWLEVVTAAVTNQTATSVDLNVASGVLADVDPQSARYRVTLFGTPANATRQGSVVREVLQPPGNGTTIAWNETSGNDENGNGVVDEQFPLPAGFVVERARVEMQEWRFSFLLTVRKTEDGQATTDVVVFFRRSFDEEDETIYTSRFERGLVGWDGQPGEAGVDDDFDGTVDNASEIGWPGSDDNRTAYLFWTSGAGVREPPLKRGGFVLDLGGGEWYRIQDYRIESATGNPAPPGSEDTRAVLLLDRDITVSSGPTQGAVLMRNVVEVFTLPPRDTEADHAGGVR